MGVKAPLPIPYKKMAQPYSQISLSHGSRLFHDFALKSLKPWMNPAAGMVVPTAGRMLDSGFVNSTVKSSSVSRTLKNVIFKVRTSQYRFPMLNHWYS